MTTKPITVEGVVAEFQEKFDYEVPAGTELPMAVRWLRTHLLAYGAQERQGSVIATLGLATLSEFPKSKRVYRSPTGQCTQ